MARVTRIEGGKGMKYKVHIFPVVRVTFPGIEAGSQVEAIKKAEAEADFDGLFARLGDNVDYADDIDCFCVDEENDPHYERSTWYDRGGKPI